MDDDAVIMSKKLHSSPRQAGDLPSSLHLEGVLRLPQVLDLFPVSRSTWWQGIKDGRYPKPLRLGPRSVGWRVQDVRKLIEGGAVEDQS